MAYTTIIQHTSPTNAQPVYPGVGFFLFSWIGAAVNVVGSVIGGAVNVVGSVAGTVWHTVESVLGLVKKAGGGVLQNTKVLVNTPMGTVMVDLSDPNWPENLKKQMGDFDVVIGTDANGKPVISFQPKGGVGQLWNQITSKETLPWLIAGGAALFLLMNRGKSR